MKEFLQQCGKPADIVSKIGVLIDVRHDGRCNFQQFIAAMKLSQVDASMIHDTLPDELREIVDTASAGAVTKAEAEQWIAHFEEDAAAAAAAAAAGAAGAGGGAGAGAAAGGAGGGGLPPAPSTPAPATPASSTSSTSSSGSAPTRDRMSSMSARKQQMMARKQQQQQQQQGAGPVSAGGGGGAGLFDSPAIPDANATSAAAAAAAAGASAKSAASLAAAAAKLEAQRVEQERAAEAERVWKKIRTTAAKYRAEIDTQHKKCNRLEMDIVDSRNVLDAMRKEKKELSSRRIELTAKLGQASGANER